MERLEPMTRAQMAHAEGINYAVMRRSDGTFTRVTTEAELNAAIAAGGTAMQVFTQVPSTAAYTDLLNRALDKPKEQDIDVNVNVTQSYHGRIANARKRLKS